MKAPETYIQTALSLGKRPDLDACLSRRIDPAFTESIAEAFYERFQNEEITLILTAEPCGIALAYATAGKFAAQLLFARKREEDKAFSALVNSKTNTTLYLPKRFLPKHEKVLIVDDCIGKGGITNALIEIVRQSGAHLVGVAVGIERKYFGGAEKIRNRGISLYAACTVKEDDGHLGIVIES